MLFVVLFVKLTLFLPFGNLRISPIFVSDSRTLSGLGRETLKVLCDDMWVLTILAIKVHEAKTFWKNPLYGLIACKILYKICINTYVLQIEPKQPWAENCQSCVRRHGRFWPKKSMKLKLSGKTLYLAG